MLSVADLPWNQVVERMAMTKQLNDETEFLFRLCLPYYLRIPDKIYKLGSSVGGCLIQTRRVEASLRQRSGTTRSVAVEAATGRLTEGSFADVPGALLRYTVVSIMFSLLCATPTTPRTLKLAARDRALQYLNRFLDLYRHIASDVDIRHLSRSEFHAVRAGHALHFQTNRIRGQQGTFEMGVLFDEKQPASIGSIELVTAEQLDKLEKGLSIGVVPALPDLLLLNARGSALRGENRLAIIDAHAAFDILSEAKAMERLVRAGRTSVEAERILEPMSTSRIWSEHLEPYLDPTDLQKTPYQKWRENWRGLRNRVVHDGYEPSDGEADEYLNDIEKLCAFVARAKADFAESAP